MDIYSICLHTMQAFYTYGMDCMCHPMAPANSYIKALTPKVTAFGNGAFKAVIKVK